MGLTINLIPDSSVSNAPAGFSAAMATAAGILEQTITDNITVNIRYGWGTYNNQSEPNLTNVVGALGGALEGDDQNYATVRNLLVANATTSNDPSIVAALPDSSAQFPGGRASFYVSSAQEKALGDFSGSTTAADGAIGFGTGWTDPSAWVGAALHEITHAMGRTTEYYAGGAPTILDMYRYSAPGTFAWTGGTPAYFSVDGGQTALANFSTTADLADYANDGLTPTDPFDSSVTSNSLSPVDIMTLQAMGFSIASASSSQQQTVTTVAPVANQAVLTLSGTMTSGLLFESTGGQLALWTVQNGTATSTTMVGSLSGGWSLVGTGDFHVSGTTDLLFANVNGDVAQWQMSNGQAVAASTIGVMASGWNIAGTGDFYGTGTDDVLFRHANGTIAQWQVQNGQAVAATVVGSTTSDWTIAAIGNLTGSGSTDDILFINSDGAVADWTIANGQAVSARTLGQTSSYWSVAGVGDFTGNGQNDILFRGQGGQIAIWSMQNGQVTGAETIGMTTADWQISGIGDVNGDGTSDIVFHSTSTGALCAWEMQSGSVGHVVNIGSGSSGWQVVPHTATTLA